MEQIPGCSATASTMKDAGVYVDDKGQGTLEDNDIFGNAFSGVEIKMERGARRSKRWERRFLLSRRWSDFRSACDDAA